MTSILTVADANLTNINTIVIHDPGMQNDGHVALSYTTAAARMHGSHPDSFDQAPCDEMTRVIDSKHAN
jgi:hypothetical protein